MLGSFFGLGFLDKVVLPTSRVERGVTAGRCRVSVFRLASLLTLEALTLNLTLSPYVAAEICKTKEELGGGACQAACKCALGAAPDYGESCYRDDVGSSTGFSCP